MMMRTMLPPISTPNRGDKSLSYIATFIFSMIVSTLSLVFVGSLVGSSKKSSFDEEFNKIRYRYEKLFREITDNDKLKQLKQSETEELEQLTYRYR